MRGLFHVGKIIFHEEGFRSFMYKGMRYILQLLSIPFCRCTVRRARPGTVAEALDFSYSRFFGLIEPAQVREEITTLMTVLEARSPERVMEIGTMNGGTLFLLTRAAAAESLLVSVDLPWGRFGYGYPRIKVPLYRTFAGPGQRLHLVRSDSHQRSTLDRVRSILGNGELDFLFLDGDHTYEGVKQDFEMYGPLVKSGGLIGFHDIVPHPPETGCDVFRFWQEISEKHEVVDEFVADWDQGRGGIGLIQV